MKFFHRATAGLSARYLAAALGVSALAAEAASPEGAQHEAKGYAEALLLGVQVPLGVPRPVLAGGRVPARGGVRLQEAWPQVNAREGLRMEVGDVQKRVEDC